MNQQIYSFTHDQLLNYLDNLCQQQREGNEKEALRTLVDFVLLKRNQWTGGLQKLMYRYFDMSFQQNDHQNLTKMLKEYRSVTQNLYSQSLNDVLAYFRDKKINKVLEDIIAKHDIEDLRNLDNIDEEEPSGGNILYDCFDIGQRKGQNELKANMRIVWNGYKSIIETVKSNSKLEELYLGTLKKLFEFALKYNRKQQFKEFCKTLGYGLHNVLGKKYVQTEATKSNYTDYENPDVNEKNVQIRFEQFEVALKLGLWQSSFEIIEDINQLLSIRKGTIKKQTYYKYYFNLSKLFKKSGYWNYYAFTYFSYYNIYIRNPRIEPKELKQITDHLLLSILSIPSFPTENLQTPESQKKILNLLSMTNKIPSREELVKIVAEKGIIESASQYVKDLWRFVFVEFSLMEVSQKLPLLKEINSNDNQENRQFQTLIEKNIISQQIAEIAKIYTKIKLSNIYRIVPFNQQVVLSTLLLSQQNGTLQFKYDEVNGIVQFKQKAEEKTAYSELNRVSKQIALIAERLNAGDSKFILKKVEDLLANGKELYEIRKSKITEFLENLKKPKKEARQEAAKEIERQRLAKEAQKNERKAKEAETKEKQVIRQKELNQKKALIKQIIKIKDRRVIRIEGKTIESLDDRDLDAYTLEEIEELKKQTEKRNKQDTENKYKKAFVKTDYIERQRRDRIAPIIKQGWVVNENETSDIIEKSRQNFENRLKKKSYLNTIQTQVIDQMAVGREIVSKKYQIDSERYKDRVTKQFKERIIHRAHQLKKQAEEQKIKMEEQRKKRQQQRLKRQAEEDANPFIIRRSNIPSGGLGASTQPAATTETTGVTGWRNTSTTATQPTSTTSTTSTTANTGWRNTGTTSATTTSMTSSTTANTTTSENTNDGGWRSQKPQPPKPEPPKATTQTNTSDGSGWRKKN